jgi:hypothetical protein
MRPTVSRRIHNATLRRCDKDHSCCAHCWDRRHLWPWLVVIIALNAVALVWHALWDRRIVTDHVQRSWRFYEK